MPSLRQLLDTAEKGVELVVVPEHANWLEMTEEEQYELIREMRPVIQPALERLIFGESKHERSGRISASGLGGCLRAQLFSYGGAPKIGENPDNIDLMSMGTHDHLWWQIEGLAMGWLREVERFVGDGFVGGSIDGDGVDVGVFELKTVRESIFTRVVQVEKTPVLSHELQFDFYGEMMDVDTGSIVYQERGGGAYYEFRVERKPEIARAREAIVERLGNHVNDDTLPPMLEDCEQRQGTIYRQCPYRKFCPKATSVTFST